MMTGTHWVECSITKKERCVLCNLSSENLRRLSASSITKNQGCDSYILYKYTLASTLNAHTMTLHELSIRAEWYTGRVEQGWKMATITTGCLSAFRLPRSSLTSSPLIKRRQSEKRKERYGEKERDEEGWRRNKLVRESKWVKKNESKDSSSNRLHRGCHLSVGGRATCPLALANVRRKRGAIGLLREDFEEANYQVQYGMVLLLLQLHTPHTHGSIAEHYMWEAGFSG